MASITTQELLERRDNAWEDKDNWISLYDDAYTLALPQRNTFGYRVSGAVKTDRLYDSTLQTCTVKLAGALQANITPPFTKWARLIPGVFIPEEDKMEWTEQLDALTDIFFAGITASNFDVAIGEFFLDLLVGTGAMLLLEGEENNPFKFITVPISEIALEEGPDAEIGAVFRKFEKPVRVLRTMWKDIGENVQLDAYIDEAGEDTDVIVHECTYRDYEEDVWRYVVLLETALDADTSLSSYGNSEGDNNDDDDDDDDALVLVEREYRENPWIITRWIRVSGEVYGRGPVLNALPDAKTLNLAKKLELQNASLAVAGVWLVKNNSVINPNTITIKPGAIIPVMSTGGSQGADLQPLHMGTSLQYSQIIISELREAIKETMFDHTVPMGAPVRTATEFITRQREMAEEIGSSFARINREFIRPVFCRMLDILKIKNYVNEDVVIDGNKIDVQIVGVLAQAQALKEVEMINNWGAMTMALVGQEAFMLSAKTEAIPERLARLLGIDMGLLRTDLEKENLLKSLAAAAAQQQPEGEAVVGAKDQGFKN